MRISLLFLVTLFISRESLAQTVRAVSGRVEDTTGLPLGNVSVILNSTAEKLSTLTNDGGVFHFSKVTSSEFVLTFTSVGFHEYSQIYIPGKDVKVYRIRTVKLKQKINELTEIIIQQKNPITIKEDTIQYSADSYKVRDGAPVEDVIKKLPGVTVDKDGNVTAQGEPVKRIG